MTTREAADVFKKMAEALRRAPDAPLNRQPRPLFLGDHLVGAAMLWSYLRDLFTVGSKETYRRDELLVLLECLQRDADLFTPGAVEMIANLWDGE